MLADSGEKIFHLVRSGGRFAQARLSRWRETADRIAKLADDLTPLNDDDLRRTARDLRWRVKAGLPLKQLLPEAYALTMESARRNLGMVYYPVQLMGGIAL
ncbi:MAG: translocase, partial [Planctomycetaceae bacterium]|nr:translocase [Planctomycetaceae bacterium]